MKKNLLSVRVFIMVGMTRVIQQEGIDNQGFTNENSLHNAALTKPDQITPIITYYMGMESDKLPLTFLTEGQEGGSEAVDDIQYYWDIMGRKKRSDVVISSQYTAGMQPGILGQPFYVIFKTKDFIPQHNIVSPSGIKCRIMEKEQLVGTNYRYTLQLHSPDATAYCPLTDLTAGTKWVMYGAPLVSESLSMGNRSNIQTPGKRRNQINILRKSYHIAGNITNKKVEVNFPINGKTTNMWMDFQEWQDQIEFREMCEEHYWECEYNRLPNGQIVMKDYDNGLVIPEGAGVFQIVREANHDTYGLSLTPKKLKNTVGDVMYGATDTQKMEVVLYGGMGFLEDFDAGIKADGNGRGFAFAESTKEITGKEGSWQLEYGAYYNKYRTVQGHTITAKWLPILDMGARAENSPLHPTTGYPLTSHSAVFVDQSMYNGKRNVQMFHQRNRMLIRGVEKGMTQVPDSWGGNASNYVATEQDRSALHLLKSGGINIRRDRHCFMLECVL